MKPHASLLTLLLLTSLIALLHTGCAQQCTQVKQGYQQALSQEESLVSGQTLSAGLPTHIGVALRYDLVGQIARNLLGKLLSEKLDLNSNIAIGSGKSVPVTLSSDALNLGFEQDAACESCFRITGDLGGDASVQIPLVGTKKIPLKGAFKLIAPIVFEAGAENVIQVKLDPSKISQFSESFLSLELNGLPEAIGRALKQPLTKALFDKLVANLNLKPINLFAFHAPEFGIKGLKLFPSQFKLLPKQKAVFLGFTSNIPGIAPNEGLNADSAVNFTSDENLAVAIQPRIIKGVITLLMQDGAIPRQYGLQGQRDASGPAHVTLNQVQFASTAAASQKDPLNIGFRAWNLFAQNGGPCFWFDALVKGVVSLENKKLKVDLQQIELVNASVAPQLIQALANWKQAEFLDRTRTLIETTLSEPKITLPSGGTLTLAPSSLARDANTVALRSFVSLKL